MFKLYNKIAYRFSNKTYDLAVIGGGPGGNFKSTKVMLLPSRQRSSISILSA